MSTESTRYRAGGDTSIGLRPNNEDAAYIGQWLYAVADGMGGHVAGEVASTIVIDTLRSYDTQVPETGLLAALGRAVREASTKLRQAIQDNPELDGMGTTLTVMLWAPSGQAAALANIGDSRAYLLRDHQLTQITEDHVLGKLVADVTYSGRPESVLVRYLDGRLDRSPDLTLREIRTGDRYLLCSDGLSGVVSPAAIRTVLASAGDADNAAHELIAAASEANGADNITAVVVDARNPGASLLNPLPIALGTASRRRPALG
jgi:PPM family protein phosphatase